MSEPAIEGDATGEAQNQPEYEVGNSAANDKPSMQIDEHLYHRWVRMHEHRSIDLRRTDDVGNYQEQQSKGLYPGWRKREDAETDGNAERAKVTSAGAREACGVWPGSQRCF